MPAKNESAVISGASSGIGAATARLFAENGYDVLLLGRSESRLKTVQQECSSFGVKTEICSFDLIEFDKNVSQFDEKLKNISSCSVLVNNAGIYLTGSFTEMKSSDWMKMFQVNLLASVQLTQHLWPLFSKNKKGSIVNVSSTLGIKPAPGTGAYSALKAAMINWTHTLAQEGGSHGIRANCICPGITDTPIHAFHRLQGEAKEKALSQMASYQLLNFIGQPEDVAKACYFIGSDNSRWTTGSILSVDGGINIK